MINVLATRSLRALSIVLALATATPAAFADGAAIVSHPPAPELGIVSVTDGSVAEINPTRTLVPSVDGFNVITSASTDTSAGVMHGYAEFELANDATTTQTRTGPPENPIVSEPKIGSTLAVAFASNALSTRATVAGGIPGGTGTVTIEMDLHGSFLATTGVPTLELIGSLGAGRVNANPLDFQVFSSNFAFYRTKFEPGSVLADFESSVSDVSGDAPFAGADFDIISAQADDLHAVLRLSFDVVAGDELVFSAGVSGLASPEFDTADSELTGLYDVDGIVLVPDFQFDDGVIDVFESAGAVDFSNTALLRVFVSPGLSLVGTDPLLSNIVVTAPVPLPATGWLLLSAVSGLGWYGRRRQALQPQRSQ